MKNLFAFQSLCGAGSGTVPDPGPSASICCLVESGWCNWSQEEATEGLRLFMYRNGLQRASTISKPECEARHPGLMAQLRRMAANRKRRFNNVEVLE